MLLVPTAARQDLRAAVLAIASPEPLMLGLYANDRIPALSDVVGDYLQPSGFGYGPVALDATAWDNAPGGATYPEVAFTFAGPSGRIYGYLVYGAVTGKLKWAERFNASFNVQNPGDQVKVVPVFD